MAQVHGARQACAVGTLRIAGGLARVLVGAGALVLSACGEPGSEPPGQTGNLTRSAAQLASAPIAEFPALTARRAAILQALAADGVLRLPETGLSAAAQRAVTLALAHAEFMADLRGPQGEVLLGEVFAAYPLRPSEQRSVLEACAGRPCWRVEKYNYARNLATVAFVALDGEGTVLGMQAMTHAAPDVPPHLAELASEIARHAPEVRAALGYAPEAADALMAATRTSLNRSRCERSGHLCVAPTFVVEERALWAIVDLTDLRLVGVRWTDVGAHVAGGWTEKSLQNEVMLRDYCDRSHRVERDGWTLDYTLTTSDGLKISDVRYHGRRVLHDAKLVDWHVNYSQADGFGYSDAVGCPAYSQAAVVAVQPPTVEAMTQGEGFVLAQGYWSDGWPSPCNYNYQQRYEFHANGDFRVVVASLGRGCGDDGTYRPVTRIAFAEAMPVHQLRDGVWQPMTEEGWLQQSAATLSTEGALLKVGDWTLEPSVGQFGDGGRGDDAYVYLTRGVPGRDEGEGDLLTIGPCCNTDHRQGPERWIDEPPESLAGAPPVLWYVAQLKNDGRPGQEYCWADTVVQDGDFVQRTWPCPSGPLFRLGAPATDGAGHGAP